MPEAWPTSSEVHAAVADRVGRLLDERGGIIAQVGRRTLSAGRLVLSEDPHSLRTILVPGAYFCASGGVAWRPSLWAAVAAECMMASADLLDDVADADPGSSADSPGVRLTAAAGLLSLAGAAVVRVVEDGAPASTAVALAQVLGSEFSSAANGQAANLGSNHQVDALAAYRQAAAKSGPLGSLIAHLGARAASDDPTTVGLLARFGRHLGVYSQLLNDARDAGPDAPEHKADVRAGSRTVPLVFAGSTGAPADLSASELAAWEARERARIAAGGGLGAAYALAEAERLHAVEALDGLAALACPTDGLRALIS
jgi:geranylgeranyl pyrophosphate synthase